MVSHKNPFKVSPPSFSASGAAALRGFLHSLGTVNCELGGFVAWLKSFRMRSYRQTPCFARFWPKLSACNPFGMRSYKIAPANSFRMRSYEKRWGEDYVFPIFEFRVPNFACARRLRPYRRDSLLFHGRWNTVHAPRPGDSSAPANADCCRLPLLHLSHSISTRKASRVCRNPRGDT